MEKRKTTPVCIPALSRAGMGNLPAMTNWAWLPVAKSLVNWPKLRFRIFRALLNVGHLFFCFVLLLLFICFALQYM